MQVRIIERAINMSRISPMTGMMPMTEDHPNRNPQQQQLNERSIVSNPSSRLTHSVSPTTNSLEDFGIPLRETGR
jgi:hypothetical protein